MALSSSEWHTLTSRNRNTCARISLTGGVTASAVRPAPDEKKSRGSSGLFLISGLAVLLVVCGTALFGLKGDTGPPTIPAVAAVVSHAPAADLPARPADPARSTGVGAPVGRPEQAPGDTPGGYSQAAPLPDRVDRSQEAAPGPPPPEPTVHQSAQTANARIPERSKTEPATRGGGRMLAMLATAYTPDCGTGDGYTATMTRPRIGVIAVDPEVIPYKTLVYVENYGYFRAEDTGGAIKGNRIDIYMHTREEALQFGRRWVDVKIIGKIEE
ncbi:MAG: 3D domain-containing protein [Bacillota bacterium]